MMSAPTIFSSSSGSLFTGPGSHDGIDGSTERLCSGAAYFSANDGAQNAADNAASVATARAFFMRISEGRLLRSTLSGRSESNLNPGLIFLQRRRERFF